jgi:putative copper resistance protein D
MEGMVSSLPALAFTSLLGDWHVRPWWLLFSWLALSAYLSAVVAARRRAVPTVHPVRVLSFVAGVVVLLFTVSSGIDRYAMALFWDHMIEHLLLIMVVPALLVVGHPWSAARAAAVACDREAAFDAFARSWPVALLTHPIVGLGLYTAVLGATHLTGFMDAMAQKSWLMGAEQWLYVATGYLYFLPLLGIEPLRWRLPHLLRPAFLIIGMTPDTVVGIVLLQTHTNMFPVMFGGHPSWAPVPIHDLHIGGAVMWVVGDGLMMLFGVGVIIAIISHSRSNQMVGRWLEGVRRSTLTEHVRAAGASAALSHDVNVDDDDAVLAAYNQMFARLNGESDSRGPAAGDVPR